MHFYFILAFSLILSVAVAEKSNKEVCMIAKNCAECMTIHPSCSWCYDDAYDDTKFGPGYRCAEDALLITRGCPKDKIEAEKSFLVEAESQSGKLVVNDQSSSADIQLTPRAQTIRVRPHDTLTVNFTFQSISDYPVDLYFLTDLSYTMIDDLGTVSKLTHDIVRTMQKVTKKLQMGFGAFVDKPVFPFVVPTPEYLRNPCLSVGNMELQCDPPFLFKHILSLTDDFEEFRAKTEVTRPSGNLDSPEGGLDALLQVAHCSDFVKWRPNARKIVLFASDGGFHLAGDGRIAGLIHPPPKTCQLTDQADRFNSSLKYIGWHTADQTDYPSVGEIAQVLTDKDISVIFAVDSKLHTLYSKLANFLPSAAVGVLSNSSTNIVHLLKENYDKIVNKAELITSYNADNMEVQVFAKCHGETEFSKKSVCLEHPVGGRIDYQISVKPKGCFSSIQDVNLKMVGLDDQAVIQVVSACDCLSCKAVQPLPPAPPVSPRCQNQGHLECGACQCRGGYSGEFCECSPQAARPGSEAVMLAQCTQPGSQVPCSERGRCICGKCKCNVARYEGPYCECDRHGCKRASDDNQVCGGAQRGTCRCDGTCECQLGYTGERCDCMESDKQCRDAKNPSELCSGRGVCDCGQCFCNSGFTGHLCNEIQGEPSALCSDLEVEQCVLCLRDALIEAFDASAKVRKAAGLPEESTSGTRRELALPYSSGDYASPEYAAAGAKCSAVCNGTIIDTKRVRLLESTEEQQKDDTNLCLIYTDDNCRVYFTYRYSDAIYVNRKVDLNIIRKSECVKTINILYIVLGVIAGIVLGGLILLLIYKLVITIDDRQELAKFERQGQNMRWELAENPIFESPTTKVINPTFEDSAKF